MQAAFHAREQVTEVRLAWHRPEVDAREPLCGQPLVERCERRAVKPRAVLVFDDGEAVLGGLDSWNPPRYGWHASQDRSRLGLDPHLGPGRTKRMAYRRHGIGLASSS